jgi:pimeloyl-ACP methyl ester carboxylesterase
MINEIATREVIVLKTNDGVVRGTYHKAYDHNRGSAVNSVKRNRVGVLFLNSLSPTRAAAGDTAVFWADSFAKQGYPSFRVDPPGFGDSDGEPPPDLLGFINSGGYASSDSFVINELTRRFNLSGVVIAGLCAGAVSAIYAAAASKESVGLVLLDPFFQVPITTGPTGRPSIARRILNRISRGTLGNLIAIAGERMRAFRMWLSGPTLPANTNFPLVAAFRTLASRGFPILVLNAPFTQRQTGQFDYPTYLQGAVGPKNRIVIQTVDGTGHSFSNPKGRATVRENTEAWLKACFPQNDLKAEEVTSQSQVRDGTTTLHASPTAAAFQRMR